LKKDIATLDTNISPVEEEKATSDTKLVELVTIRKRGAALSRIMAALGDRDVVLMFKGEEWTRHVSNCSFGPLIWQNLRYGTALSGIHRCLRCLIALWNFEAGLTSTMILETSLISNDKA
jgi:hypothetical protein